MSDLDFRAIREKYQLVEAFPDAVEQDARTVRDRFAAGRIDARHLELVTLDPPGAKDLDQAVRIDRTEAGFTLWYAIADVGAFIAPGTPLDEEARRRGQTKYLPDGTIPLYPRILTEQIASLVADEDRPAVLWQIEVDADGTLRRGRVRRAIVRVRARLDYPALQAQFDRGEALPEPLAALPAFGDAREARARERGAVELQLPEQDLVHVDGHWRLRLEPRTHMDVHNSHCSLATGIAAANIMLAARVGLLRTLPAPDERTLRQFRLAARALGVDAGDDLTPGDILASLPIADARSLALNAAATKLLRGSGYLAFDARGDEKDARPTPEQAWHNGVASEYAHATAPIRRLGDRFVSELCLAFGGDWVPLDVAPKDAPRLHGEVDEAILAALPDLPGILMGSGRVAATVENACINLAESVALHDRIGDVFEAVLLRPGDDDHHAEVFVTEPPVIAQCHGEVPAGQRVRVRLVEADPESRKVRFTYPASDGDRADAREDAHAGEH